MRALVTLGLLLTLAGCTSTPRAPDGTAITPPIPTGCASDDDCRAVSSYCGGCKCLPALASVSDTECTERQVQCLIDPCQGRHAVCSEGACTIVGSPGQGS